MKEKLYFLAEVACDHEGDFKYLLDLIDLVKNAGIPYIKFQPLVADQVFDRGHSDYFYFKSIEFSKAQWFEAIDKCYERSLGVFLDVYGDIGLELLEERAERLSGVKIPTTSLQNNNIRLRLNSFAGAKVLSITGKKFIEISELVTQLEGEIVLSYGAQSFPTNRQLKGGPPQVPILFNDISLSYIQRLIETFPNITIGVSDHLEGESLDSFLLPMIACSRGVGYIEKHVTATRKDKREDYFSASHPESLGTLFKRLQCLSPREDHEFKVSSDFDNRYLREFSAEFFFRSNLKAGAALSLDSVESRRTGKCDFAIRPNDFVGRILIKDVEKGEGLRKVNLKQAIGIFCNARFGSTRLPGKALLEINRVPVLEILLRRLSDLAARLNLSLVFATGEDPDNDDLERLARSIGVTTYRGENLDVMGRMRSVAQKFCLDHIVRVTGDDPFVDTELIEHLIECHLSKNMDYTMSDAPSGFGSEVISTRVLECIHPYVQRKDQTEYLTWFLDDEFLCHKQILHAPQYSEAPWASYSIDTIEDLISMRRLVEHHFPDAAPYDLSATDIFRGSFDQRRESSRQTEDHRFNIDTSIIFRRSK